MPPRKPFAVDFPISLTPASEFLAQRVDGLSLGDFEDALRRAIIELLHNDTPLDAHWRRHVASELEMLYFRTRREHRLARGQHHRQMRKLLLEAEINSVAKKGNISPAKAKEKIEEHGGPSVDNIKKILDPKRVAGKKRLIKK
jgi:hypothetical protein